MTRLPHLLGSLNNVDNLNNACMRIMQKGKYVKASSPCPLQSRTCQMQKSTPPDPSLKEHAKPINVDRL